ncbi:MAG: hypothetical protein AAF824_16480 [Bacteroidota bacterium]
MKKLLCSVLMLILGGTTLLAQELTISPYSRYGIGDIQGNINARNAAMGGISIATDNYFSINRQNPGSFADLVYTTLDISGFGQYSSLRSDITNEDQVTAGFQNIGLGFSSNRKVILVMGFAPYSIVGYNVNSLRENIAVGDTTFSELANYQGQGGLNQVYGGIGVRLLKRKLRVGASFNFNFGRTEYSSEATLNTGATNFLPARFDEDIYLSGPGASFGGMYVIDSIKGTDGVFLRLGASMDIQSTLEGSRQTFLVNSFDPTSTLNDTIRDQEGDVILPLRIGVGAMIHKPARWSLGADFVYQDWSTFEYFDDDVDLGADWRVSVGGEWTPNYESNKYFNRVSYRFGGYVKQSYILFEEEAVNDVGVTFGFALPSALKATNRFDRGRASSRINMSFIFGRRGNLNSQPLEELYARFQLGVTLNDTWFVRRVID